MCVRAQAVVFKMSGAAAAAAAPIRARGVTFSVRTGSVAWAGMVAHTCDLSNWEAEAGELP